jgi:hypothetical protein
MVRAAICLLLLAGVAQAEVLTDFRPSPLASSHGVVSQVEFSTGLVELEPGSLAMHLPQAMRNLSFAEPVWLVAYKTYILDPGGRPPRENYLCHTFFGDQRVMQSEDQELLGLYSDAFTPEVRLPEGFGVPVAAREPVHWMPMFNNRGLEAAWVRMKVELSVIREKDLARPLKPLYAALRSVALPHLYFVPPGGDARSVTFELPFDGAIHFLGTHMHPHGVSIELFNVSRGESVWKGTRKVNAAGEMTGMETYSSTAGYPVRAGETYRVTAVYENPASGPIDAMAGLYILYSRE